LIDLEFLTQLLVWSNRLIKEHSWRFNIKKKQVLDLAQLLNFTVF